MLECPASPANDRLPRLGADSCYSLSPGGSPNSNGAFCRLRLGSFSCALLAAAHMMVIGVNSHSRVITSFWTDMRMWDYKLAATLFEHAGPRSSWKGLRTSTAWKWEAGGAILQAVVARQAPVQDRMQDSDRLPP
ncbi:unnamed protein product [Symbiodinium pilosum]|uniref:Uncharacterized protein n=1 Tax=Symbiodinium pilosum TaxID=2952 RepID=A0A812VDJ2_SYMPI|nr:unnamed protein product [Symbiodinium pilosum]